MNNVTYIVNEAFNRWSRLAPVYFPKWMWQKAVYHEPKKYSMHLPVYQGQKVIIT